MYIIVHVPNRAVEAFSSCAAIVLGSDGFLGTLWFRETGSVAASPKAVGVVLWSMSISSWTVTRLWHRHMYRWLGRLVSSFPECWLGLHSAFCRPSTYLITVPSTFLFKNYAAQTTTGRSSCGRRKKASRTQKMSSAWSSVMTKWLMTVVLAAAMTCEWLMYD